MTTRSGMAHEELVFGEEPEVEIDREAQEWLEAFDSVIEMEGQERAQTLLDKLVVHAVELGIPIPEPKVFADDEVRVREFLAEIGSEDDEDRHAAYELPPLLNTLNASITGASDAVDRAIGSLKRVGQL